MTMRRLYQTGAVIVFLLAVFTIWTNRLVKKSSAPYLVDHLEEVPGFKVGLLLGTSQKLNDGRLNEFFYNRIAAAVDLYKNRKIKYVLNSGDHGTAGYNEPRDMKQELINRGIPDSVIYLDYAGFRTLDSVVRARAVFGQSRFLVISQCFHNERAVYLARAQGIEAFGYNAKDVSEYKGVKTMIREVFAKTKAWLDLRLGVQPRYLGPQIKIG